MKIKKRKFKNILFMGKWLFIALLLLYSIVYISIFLLEKKLYANLGDGEEYVASFMCSTHAIIENEKQRTLSKISIKKHIKYCNFTNVYLKKAILKKSQNFEDLDNIDVLIKDYLTDHIEEVLIKNNQFTLLKTSYQNDTEDIYKNKFLNFVHNNNEYDSLIVHLEQNLF